MGYDNRKKFWFAVDGSVPSVVDWLNGNLEKHHGV